MEAATADLERDRLAALQLANEVRRARADLKRRVAEGTVAAADVLLDPPPSARRLPVRELLMSQRHWGHRKTKRLLARNQISESNAIRDLSDNQRQLLAAQLAR